MTSPGISQFIPLRSLDPHNRKVCGRTEIPVSHGGQARPVSATFGTISKDHVFIEAENTKLS